MHSVEVSEEATYKKVRTFRPDTFLKKQLFEVVAQGYCFFHFVEIQLYRDSDTGTEAEK